MAKSFLTDLACVFRRVERGPSTRNKTLGGDAGPFPLIFFVRLFLLNTSSVPQNKMADLILCLAYPNSSAFPIGINTSTSKKRTKYFVLLALVCHTARAKSHDHSGFQSRPLGQSILFTPLQGKRHQFTKC